MSYRTVTVNGTDYQYSIGRTFVKIRGVREPIPHEKIGHRIAFSERYMITPGTIIEYILNGKVEQPTKCRCGKRCTNFEQTGQVGSVNGLRADPFEAEIHDKTRLGFWCDACIEEMGMAI